MMGKSGGWGVAGLRVVAVVQKLILLDEKRNVFIKVRPTIKQI